MTPALDLAKRRYSCRKYLDRPLEVAARKTLDDFLASLSEGPFGGKCRFALIASTPEDSGALKGLGTYGFIRGAASFIAGTVRSAPRDLEDYGYCLEQAVLKATDMELGTCWLGGSFTKSSFAAKIAAREDEVVPAVVAIGYPADGSRDGWMRKGARSDSRLAPDRLFYDKTPATPLDIHRESKLTHVLEVVRQAPSASNKQPWRFVRTDEGWHLYLERTPGYGRGRLASLVKTADLQRVDMGIAMCHFELAAKDAEVTGGWRIDPPAPSSALGSETATAGWEYIASWVH